MKVTNQTGNKLQGVGAKKVGATRSDRANTAKTKLDAAELTNSAKVDLSPRAKEAQKAKEIAMGTPDVNEAKIAKLRDMIDRGQYKVDAEAVANKLVDANLMDAAADE